ncbi:MAG TPA: hypothetical protein PK264_23120 [Hyphomicrobiaceae bacterium]|nr:hypothetical protein [Hyphomicrobiaceae bacterium]
MTTFATLGPAGTNHALVTRRYIEFHGLREARIALVATFDEAVADILARRADFVVQCAVHPDTPRILGANYRRLFAIDSFISPSRELAILTRAEIVEPTSIGLVMPATEGYADLSQWKVRVPERAIPIILEKLLAGQIDSGLVYLDYAERHPGRFRVEAELGSPDDVWIVYGRERAYRGELIACRHGLAASRYAGRE